MAAPHNRCAVHADAGESAVTGRRTRRAAELRCSGRSDRPSPDRPTSALRSRCDRDTSGEPVTLIVLPPPSRCLHAPALLGRPLPRRSGAWSASNAPAASALSCASPFSRSLRSGTLGVVPRDCVRRLRPRTKPDPAGAPRARWSCAPGTPAAPHGVCSPHPRIAREVRAPNHHRRARSRGSRRPCDITRDYAAHLLCVQARHAPSLAHEIPRPRNPSLCHMAASASVRLLRWQRIHALHCWRPARAARVCAPSLACRLDQRAAVARGLLCAAPVRSRPRAAHLAHRGASLPRPLNCV